MPQAPIELTEKWGGACGIGDDKAMNFLISRGFTIDRFCWKRPHPGYEIQPDEWEAMDFLILEWDWGGIIDDPQPSPNTREERE